MKQLIFLALLLISTCKVQAQISYDFISKELKIPKNGINDIDKTFITLFNFNPFLYKYTITTKTETYNSEIPKLLKNSDGNIFTIEDFLTKIKIQSTDDQSKKIAQEDAKKEVLKTIFKIEKCFLKFYDPNYQFHPNHKIPDDYLSELETLLSKLVLADPTNSDIVTYFNKLISYKKFNTLFNKELFNKTIKLGELDADILKINFTFQPIETEITTFDSILSKDSINIELPIQRKKGYLTYSTGLFISGLGNPTYAIQNKKIIEEEGSGNAFGFNALAHYMWDVQKNTALGFHLGLGTPFLKGNLSVVGLAGVTAAFGKKNRFLLNTGPTFGMIKALSSSNYKDEKKDTLIDGLSEVKTYQKLKANWAFSITYNLNK